MTRKLTYSYCWLRDKRFQTVNSSFVKRLVTSSSTMHLKRERERTVVGQWVNVTGGQERGRGRVSYFDSFVDKWDNVRKLKVAPNIADRSGPHGAIFCRIWTPQTVKKTFSNENKQSLRKERTSFGEDVIVDRLLFGASMTVQIWLEVVVVVGVA